MTKRVFLIVLDSFGVGYMPDAEDFGDKGADTLKSCFSTGKLNVPNMQSLGLFNIDGVTVGEKFSIPKGAYMKIAERSRGKDTTTGHWEISGIVSEKPFPTFPDGFPDEVIKKFKAATGRGVLCNKPYSGTKVIADYGEEHLRTGDLIVYTSADSVFQIAAHESSATKAPCTRMIRSSATIPASARRPSGTRSPSLPPRTPIPTTRISSRTRPNAARRRKGLPVSTSA